MSCKENSFPNHSEVVIHIPLVQAHIGHSNILPTEQVDRHVARPEL